MDAARESAAARAGRPRPGLSLKGDRGSKASDTTLFSPNVDVTPCSYIPGRVVTGGAGGGGVRRGGAAREQGREGALGRQVQAGGDAVAEEDDRGAADDLDRGQGREGLLGPAVAHHPLG